MAEDEVRVVRNPWPVNLTWRDKDTITALAKRRAALRLPHTFAETIRAAVALAATASDDELIRGEL